MEKKFWERDDFDIAMFYAVFQGVYDLFYDYRINEPDVLWKRFDVMRRSGDYTQLIARFAEYRQDLVTSDREAAAFVVACDIYERRYESVK